MHIAQATVWARGRSKRVPMRSVILLACALAASSAACTASAEEVRPPEDQIFFPTGAAVSPDASLLFFASDIVGLDFMAGGPLRLIVPTRGDPSVAWIDWDGSKLSCNPSAEGFALCDENHRLAYIHNDPDIGLLPDEPFDAYAGKDFAIVTHLTTGAVTLIDSPLGGNASIADVAAGLFAPD